MLMLWQIATKVADQTQPADEEECWFVEGNGGDTSGYPVKKLWKKGERNKWRLHRVLFFLKNKDMDETSQANDIAHLCRRGRFDHEQGVTRSCVNPFHTASVPHAINLEHNQCANGCRGLCPHTPKCLWTTEEGRRMKCRDLWPLPAVCACGQKCFG
jgi:hypothetical protein